MGYVLISRLDHRVSLTCRTGPPIRSSMSRFLIQLSYRLFPGNSSSVAEYSEGGILKTRLSFPQEFPLLPPKMKFITPMWHPNSQFTLISTLEAAAWCLCSSSIVYADGNLCISILHEPGEDQYGYEDAGERWLPVHTVESIVSFSPTLTIPFSLRLLI
jgi:hypothetical protein